MCVIRLPTLSSAILSLGPTLAPKLCMSLVPPNPSLWIEQIQKFGKAWRHVDRTNEIAQWVSQYGEPGFLSVIPNHYLTRQKTLVFGGNFCTIPSFYLSRYKRANGVSSHSPVMNERTSRHDGDRSLGNSRTASMARDRLRARLRRARQAPTSKYKAKIVDNGEQ